MTIEEARHLLSSYNDLWDFVSNACDGDESGILQHMKKHIDKSEEIVQKELRRLYLRNAKARLRRNK